MTTEIKKEFSYSESMHFEENVNELPFPFEGTDKIEVRVTHEGVFITTDVYDRQNTVELPHDIFHKITKVVERGIVAHRVASGDPASVEQKRPTNNFNKD